MPTKQKALTLVELLVVIGIIGLVVALLLPQVRSSREAARRNQCLNNMKQLTLAIQTCESNTGRLPPTYTVDEDGNRLHSWRTLIIPYRASSNLFEIIDMERPWNHPENAKAREWANRGDLFQCPSTELDLAKTTYLAVVGPECAFTGSTGRLMSDFNENTSGVILHIDAPETRAIHWMSPKDIRPEELLAIDIEEASHHPGIFLAAFLDGHIERIDSDIDREVLRSMLTIAGGEAAEE